MTNGKSKNKVSFRPNDFAIPKSPGDTGHLIGSKCKGCGDYAYPRRKVCPICNSEDMEITPLSPKGSIYTFTIVRQTFPMMVLSNSVPFITAQVILPEKAYLLTLLQDCDIDKVKVGMDVELCFFKAQEDEENEYLVPAFKPV